VTSSSIRIRAVLAELDALGISVEELVAARDLTPKATQCQTVLEYLAVVEASYGASTAGTYRSYWSVFAALHGDKSVSSVTYDDCAAVVAAATERARGRRGSDGRGAQENCIAALRAFFERARRSGLLSENPARDLAKPRRHPGRRRGLTVEEVDSLRSAIAETSRDPALDLLLVAFHLQTGARRQGALSLRIGDLDLARSTIWLHEKFGIDREQPIGASLLDAIGQLARERGGVSPTDAVFRLGRHRDGQHPPLSRRHYNTLFDRARPRLDWAARTEIGAHVLRHTAITNVERLAGMAVAAAFAGHRPAGVTAGYAKAGIHEVAAVVARLTGEPHPLAPTADGASQEPKSW
jgi:integrase